MIYDLEHELETIKFFLKHGTTIVSNELINESNNLSEINQPSEEYVEQTLTSPYSSESLGKIICRAVINELNSLCEFALQNTWIKLSGYQLELPNKNLIFTAKRIDIEDSLRDEKILGSKKTDVENWPRWSEVKKIKEISEGFKHRQRLQPFPNEAHSRKTPAWMTQRLVEPDNENWLVNYELSLTDVVGYVDAVGELLYWLKSNRMF